MPDTNVVFAESQAGLNSTKQNFNATSTRNRIMASTMSVDEYFDELIDKVREDYANSERLLAEYDKAKSLS